MIFDSHRIRRKLIMLILLTSCTTLVLATFGFAVSDWHNSRAELIKHMNSTAGIIGNNSVAALTFSDEFSATLTLSSLKGEQNIVGAYLYNADRKLFASYKSNNAGVTPQLPDRASGSIGELLYVVRSIVLDGEKVGYLLLMSDLSQWKGHQFERLSIVLLLFSLAVLVAAILSTQAQKLFTSPLLRLAGTARKIAETKNYNLRAEVASDDEIGLLADDFNEMLDLIQRRDKELLEARDELENKVKKRTAALYELTRELEHQAYHDALTGLANRSALDEKLQGEMSFAQRHKHQLAILFLDLDRFKDINDTLGHDVGDKLLVELANKLKGCLRVSDTLARLGGDEFAVLLQESNPQQAADVATKLIEAIREPIVVDGHSLQVTTSIGISIFPTDGLDASKMLKNADTAMYSSKEDGRNRYSFFNMEMNKKTERRMQLEHKLKQAVQTMDFEVYYQPKWQVSEHKLIGLEALIRWYDDEEGFISPAEFIPLAEDCGLINLIDQWVAMTACTQVLGLFEGEHPDLLLSVNFSPSHFIRDNVAEDMMQLLAETGYPADALELEITETLVASELDSVYQQLCQIRALGIEISIDDFGIAYSSLSRLKQLPLNTLKIDRSFIQDIGEDADDEVIVRTIIDMAHNLNLKVVAEGVEKPHQYEFIKRYKCDAVQGFMFSKPLPLDEVRRLILSHQERPTA
ncbi:EAL domain-containing protein [uncultured Neptuniibacter sp.]|uniref:EAL domain-containing protein n=1 Tax=uncultured Neptuniibacter sp. TaxID=502143 RepID=UPI00260293D5|nr:EAL domain-containing protein [uncultured Neptuniibacter sp.]